MGFLKIVFYKLYRLLEKNSKGDEEHCAYNAFLFTSLFPIFNAITFFYFFSEVFRFRVAKSGVVLFTSLALLFILIYFYRKLITTGKYKLYIQHVSQSSYKGYKGNLLVGIYMVITIMLLLLLVLFFLKKYNAI